MNRRIKYIVAGMFACAAVSFAGVSCMQFMASEPTTYIDMDTIELVQTEDPKEGDPTATIKTTEGDIKFVMYPEYAPIMVEKFTSLAQSGYYDDTYVFQAEAGVFFDAGSPTKNGELDENKPEGTEQWEQEINQNLWPFRGALCSIATGTDGGFWKKLTGDSKVLNGSKFTVVNSIEFTEEIKSELLSSDENTLIAEKFIELGGAPAISQKLTIFGQAYEGFDVIDRITALETQTDEDGLQIPVKDVKIKTIEIGTYSSKSSTEFETR